MNLKKFNTGDEESELIYTEEDLHVKLESLNLSNNQYKNKTFDNDFEDEDLIMKKTKNKVNSKGETGKINNKVYNLYN